MPSPALNAVVTLVDRISPWLMRLQVVPDGGAIPSFEPGQYTTLGLPARAPRCGSAQAEATVHDPDLLIRRVYCIASSAANREYLEFFIHLVPQGALTPRLFALAIGDRLWISDHATGAFTFGQVPAAANVVMMATGTGLAPFVSMLGTHLRFQSQRRVAVLHGVRNSWDLGYRSVLAAMQHLRDNFTYLPIVSRPGAEPAPWPGATGHVQDVWKGTRLAECWGARPTPADTHVFLCGSPHMIDDAAAMLRTEGFRESRPDAAGEVHIERYWTASPTAHGTQS
ncbi:MAG: ferredoxin--NADP reductase [Burkholderiales bacterium]